MRPLQVKPCLIVAGPTCSGKSALALALARQLDGVVINADAMQVYAELRILTARPTPADEALAPHRLYGVRPAAQPGSVAWWRTAALAELEAAWAAGRLPILCGGTGLYLRALTDGLADIPEPPDAVRREARALLDQVGAPALHARLAAVDPASAARLRPADGQRLARAWEVWRGTGRGIAAWTTAPGLPPAPGRFAAIRLAPPRPGVARGHPGALRRHAGGRRAGGGGGAAGAVAGPRAAGDAGARRAGTGGGPARRAGAAAGRRTGGAGAVALYQAAGDLVRAPRAGTPNTHN